MADGEHEADGWGVLHDRSALAPSEYERLYMVGPFPHRELAELIKAQLECPCLKTIVPMFFPPGMTMMVTIPVFDDLPLHAEDEGPIH